MCWTGVRRFSCNKPGLTNQREDLQLCPSHALTERTNLYLYVTGFWFSYSPLFQITLQEGHSQGALIEEDGRSLDYQSEPSLDIPSYRKSSLHKTYQSSPLQIDSFAVNSRSLSLKSAGRRGTDKVPLHPIKSEGAASTPYKSIFSPNSLSNRNGSLSYDSLLNPMSPSGRKCIAHSAVSSVGYHSPYLSAKMCHLRGSELQRQPPQSFSPVLGSPAPHQRDPSPVRYDNLSKTIMASIQERKEMEEREKLLHSHPDSVFADSGVYDTPSSYSLQQVSTLSEDPRSMAMRYGSRDNLMAASSFSTRNPILQSSVSSLSSAMTRAPRTSTTSLQADLANNNVQSHQALQGRVSNGSYKSPGHQVPSSPTGMPRSPSYGGPKAVSFVNTVEITEVQSVGAQRYVLLEGLRAVAICLWARAERCAGGTAHMRCLLWATRAGGLRVLFSSVTPPQQAHHDKMLALPLYLELQMVSFAVDS